MMACLYPYLSKLYGELPCGTCPDCRKRRVNSWAFRLSWEDRRSTSCHFVTLTYASEYLSFSPKGYATLNTRDLQLFFKRLRKAVPEVSLRYLACGEYGYRNARPHYHIILFNMPDDKLGSVYSSWDLGLVDIDLRPVESAAFAYVAGYALKAFKKHKPRWDDRLNERIYVSKGIGSNYVDANGPWHRSTLTPYVGIPGGVKLAIPRYLKLKIFNTEELMTVYRRHCDSLPEVTSRTQYFHELLRHYDGNHYFAFEALTLARREYTKNFYRLHTKSRS